jgi:plastocyanin
MKTLLATICACLALGLVVAGCGGDDDDGDSGSAPAATTEEPADTTTGGGDDTSGGGAASDAVSVSMKDIAFSPSEAKVPKGGSVTWTNDDSVGHDVTKQSGPGGDFSSGEPGAMSGGDTFTQKFDTPGTIQYVCTVHPGMEGTVVVAK